jgi:hypothetical protein
MASDIDELLEFLRAIETCTRDHGIARNADRPARWIAAVEELRTQASLQAMANSVVVNERTADGDQANH